MAPVFILFVFELLSDVKISAVKDDGDDGTGFFYYKKNKKIKTSNTYQRSLLLYAPTKHSPFTYSP